MKTAPDEDFAMQVREISDDMKNLKQSLDALNGIEQSSSSEIVREVLRQKRIDLIQVREFLNAILEHVNYE